MILLSQFIEMFGDPIMNPIGWPLVPLKDCLQRIDSGKSITCESFPRTGNAKAILKLSAITYGEYAPSENKQLPSESLFIPDMEVLAGDLLFSRKNTLEYVGITALVKDTPAGLMLPDLIFRLITKETVCKQYLHLLINHPQFRCMISSLATGTAGSMPNISKQKLTSLSIPLPPIEVQKRIEPLVAQSDKSKFGGFKSQFIEMFGLPEDNAHGFTEGTIADVVQDVHYGTSRKAAEDGKYTYLRMNNITVDGQLDLSDIKHIDVPEKELKGCLVRRGDVLFNRTNSRELVGKTCAFNEAQPMVIAGYIIRLRMNGKVLPEYLSIFMNLERSKELLFCMAKGAVGQANINAQEVQAIQLLIPPMAVQQEFAKLVAQSDKSK